MLQQEPVLTDELLQINSSPHILSSTKQSKLITTPRTRIQQVNPEYVKDIAMYLMELLSDTTIKNSVFMLQQQKLIENFVSWDLTTCEQLCRNWLSKCSRVYIIYTENDSSHVPIGLVLVHYIEDLGKNQVFLSVFVHPSLRGQGLGTEAAKAIIRTSLFPNSTGHFADHFDIHTTFGEIESISSIVERNEYGHGWQVVLERLGFKSTKSITLLNRPCQVLTISKRQFAALWTYDSEDYHD